MKSGLYLAAPLFSVAEQTFNSSLERQLSPWFEVFLPQRDGLLFTELVAKGDTIDSARQIIFRGDIAAIRRSEVFLVVLDGRTVDEGASFELGFAYALGKTCLGLQTDPRRLLPMGNNPMIDSALSRVFNSTNDLIQWLQRHT